MIKRFLSTFVIFVFCVPCFATELPSVPELIKRMYDYRKAIENMRAEVTVTRPVNTRQPHAERMKQQFYFAYDGGRLRCDWIISNLDAPDALVHPQSLHQRLSTPEFYVVRHPFPRDMANIDNPMFDTNEGNSLSIRPPLERPLETLDLRRLGTDVSSIDVMHTRRFNYDNLLEMFYNPRGENYKVSIDVVDGEKLYKISYQVSSGGILNSYWLNPQKGYNLVRVNTESEMRGLHISYTVTLGTSASRQGDIWFPQRIYYRHQHGDAVSEEKIVVNSIAFDLHDDTPFTLAGLEIPIGWLAGYHVGDGRAGVEIKYWDGKGFVGMELNEGRERRAGTPPAQ